MTSNTSVLVVPVVIEVHEPAMCVGRDSFNTNEEYTMHYKKTIAQIVGAGAIIALSAGSAFANLLVNPSFEDPDTPFGGGGAPEYPGATGWDAFGGVFTIEDFVTGVPAKDGNQVLKTFGVAGVFQEHAVAGGDIVDFTAFAMNGSYDPMGTGQVAAGNIEWFDSPGVCTDEGFGCVVSLGASIQGDTAALDVWSAVGVIGAVTPATSTIARVVLITGDFAGPGGGAPVFDDADLTVTAIPVPAAVWLFGSGLIGLVGVARRRKA